MAFNMHSITDTDLQVALSVDVHDSAEAHAYGLRNIDAWFAPEEAGAMTAYSSPKDIAKVGAPSLDGVVDDEASAKARVAAAAAAAAVVLQEAELDVVPFAHATATSRPLQASAIGTNKQRTTNAEHGPHVAESGDPMSIDSASGGNPAPGQIAPAKLSDVEQETVSALLTLNASLHTNTARESAPKIGLSEQTPPSTMAPGIKIERPPRTPRAALPHSSGRRTRSTPGAAALRAAMDEEQRKGATPESSPVPFTYARQRGTESLERDEEMATEDFEDVPEVAKVKNGDGDSKLQGKKRKLAVSTSQKPSKRTKQTDSAAPSSVAEIAVGDKQSDIITSGEDHHELELEIDSAVTKLPAQAHKSTPPKSKAQAKDSKPVNSRRSTMANELRALTGKATSKRQPATKQVPKPVLGSKSRPKKVTSQLPSELVATNVFAAETGATATPAEELKQMLPGIDAYVHPKVQAPQSAVSGKLEKLAVADGPKVKTQRRSARVSGVAAEEVEGKTGAMGKRNVTMVKPNAANAEPAKKKRGRPPMAGSDGLKVDAEKVTKRRKSGK
ncbi:hypothetical protein B0A48_16873 [Cryoendolithus antarcticus]|uniref:Uncharacterized protein n=1 Tax=Cryoendolithus antarcticus TaxID=1507870 RepID=A0A1V8SDB2_9PEZI|nr:hypothetical protein B0A48_16873 [Cryoendolithus antarcticus]